MNRISIAAVTTLAAAALALGACGDDDEDTDSAATPAQTTTTGSAPAAGGGETLTLSADPGGALKFDKSTLTAKAGTVTISMANPSDLPHAVSLEGNGVAEGGETVSKGGTSTVTADLEPGTYTYYCPVGNHRDGGMEGALTVE